MSDFMEYGWEDEIVNESGDYTLLPEGDTISLYKNSKGRATAVRKKYRHVIKR